MQSIEAKSTQEVHKIHEAKIEHIPNTNKNKKIIQSNQQQTQKPQHKSTIQILPKHQILKNR